MVDLLFRNLKPLFPAAIHTVLKTPDSERLAKRQWIAAFAENGIRTKEQLAGGMKMARSSPSDFWPSPGKFIQWCKQEQLPESLSMKPDELYHAVMRYSSQRGLYDDPVNYPWESGEQYFMVTALYTAMRQESLTESELLKRCQAELIAMGEPTSKGWRLAVKRGRDARSKA